MVERTAHATTTVWHLGVTGDRTHLIGLRARSLLELDLRMAERYLDESRFGITLRRVVFVGIPSTEQQVRRLPSAMSTVRLLALCLALALAACSPARGSGLDVMPADRYFFGSDGARLHYRGFGAGPDTLVVVHGFQGNSSAYLAPDLLPLAQARTLVVYDQRGSGRPIRSPALHPQVSRSTCTTWKHCGDISGSRACGSWAIPAVLLSCSAMPACIQIASSGPF